MNANMTRLRWFSKSLQPCALDKSSLCIGRVNPLILTAPKCSLAIYFAFAGKSKVMKIFDEEMSIRTLPTTLLQIFCKVILNFRVIVKSITDPDENLWKNSYVLMG